MKKLSWLSVMLLSACVTINIYFPAAAAGKVADELIKDIQDNKIEKLPNQTAPEPQSSLSDYQIGLYKLIDKSVSFVISTAQAADADLSIDSPDIRQITASMEKRFPMLKSFYITGVIGIKADGFLAVRNAANVPLKDRNQVNKLVAAENFDRQALYNAIANANGQPEWAAEIKTTFATRWVSNAQSGWWYQSSGAWKQK
jgi:uncharacterized protein